MHLSDLRPRLAPGLRVVRRGLHHLQIGLSDDRSVLLPRSEVVEQTLAELLMGTGAVGALSEEPASRRIIERLDRDGLLVWDQPARGPRPHVALLGRVTTPGLPDVGELLGAAGVAITCSLVEAEVVLVLSAGELDRDRLDALVRAGTTHLVVRLVDGGAVLGPFVVPGVTACLRCLDAHLSLRDPDHVAVTARYVRATAGARPDGRPDLDPALASLALAWAVRDVVAHLTGAEPSTWSRTVHLGPAPTTHIERTWLRHPGCGCSWPADLVASDCTPV